MSPLGHDGRRKLQPFRVLCLVLYGTYGSVVWGPDQRVTVTVGPFAKLVGCSNYMLKAYLSELARHRYIGGLTHSYGYSTFRVLLPPQDRLLAREPTSSGSPTLASV